MPDEPTPEAGGDAQDPTVSATPTPEPEPETMSMPKTAFDERLEQAGRSAVTRFLRSMGFGDAESLKAFKANAEEQAKSAEEAKRAEMSELEQAKTDLEAAQVAKAEATTTLESYKEEVLAAQTEARITRLGSERGVKDVEYLFFKVEQACDALEDEETLDEVKFIDDLIKDEKEAYKLGITGEPPPPKKQAATTTQVQTGSDPQPDGGNSQIDAMKMSKEEFAALKANLGLSH
jgi:hypothetical protein